MTMSKVLTEQYSKKLVLHSLPSQFPAGDGPYIFMDIIDGL